MRVHKFIAFILIFCAFASFGQEKESDRLKKQQKELEKRIGLTQNLLDNALLNKENLSENINLIERKIQYRQALLDNLDIQLTKLFSDIESLTAEIARLTLEIEKQKTQYRLMIIQAYKMRNSKAALMFILSSESFNQANKRMEYLEQLAKYRSDQIRKIENATLKLIEERKRY